jgi:NADH-quinone oxidoreductase subunit N
MIELNLHAALPEIWIAVSAMVLLLIGAYVGDRAMRLIGLLSIAVMVVAIVAMLGIDVSTVPQLAFGGHFIVDRFGVFAKVQLIPRILVWIRSLPARGGGSSCHADARRPSA